MVEANEKDFYDTFLKVFERNAIYSKQTPAPLFGGIDTDLELVHDF